MDRREDAVMLEGFQSGPQWGALPIDASISDSLAVCLTVVVWSVSVTFNVIFVLQITSY